MNKKEKLIGSISILVLAIIFLITGYFLSNKQEADYDDVFIQFDKSEKENNQITERNVEEINIHKDESIVSESIQVSNTINNGLELSEIKVDIKGAVKNPGIYTLKNGSRVADLIELAGGLTLEADYDSVYLSKKLCDEDFIYVKKVGEEKREDLPESKNLGQEEKSHSNTYNINNQGKININTATLEELKTLPGIGDVKAQSIINYRNTHGKFNSVKELMNIEGIGEKTIAKLQNEVTF